jgi:hypothetical protein
MAVAVVMDFEGATLAQYDQIIGKMGFKPGGPGGPGSVSHWVAATDAGIRVVDVWESAKHFQSFADDQIGPISEEVGIPNPPDITFHEVHNYLTAG